MEKFRFPLILQCLIFLIPLNIYMWGDWMIVNAQWALFRYQLSEFGSSLIPGHNDLLYIYLGLTTGFYNIAAALLWTAGAAILLIGLCITIIAITREEFGKFKTASNFTIIGGIFLCISGIFRFNGGFAIPVGVPVILIIGWWMYQENFEPDETNEDDVTDEDDDTKEDFAKEEPSAPQ